MHGLRDFIELRCCHAVFFWEDLAGKRSGTQVSDWLSCVISIDHNSDWKARVAVEGRHMNISPAGQRCPLKMERHETVISFFFRSF